MTEDDPTLQLDLGYVGKVDRADRIIVDAQLDGVSITREDNPLHFHLLSGCESPGVGRNHAQSKRRGSQ